MGKLGEWVVKEAPASPDLFDYARLLAKARQACDYARRKGIYDMFLSGIDFRPSLTNCAVRGGTMPILAMLTESEEGTLLGIGAHDMPGEGLCGFCSIRQSYSDGGFCLIEMYLKEGKPAFFCAAIEGKDFHKKPQRIYFFNNYDGEPLAQRNEISEVFARFGLNFRPTDKIDMESLERLLLCGAKGQLATSGEICTDDVMRRLFDLLRRP